MAKKQTQLEKVIAEVDSRIATLQAARVVLVEQQAKTPRRAAKTTKPAPAHAADRGFLDDDRR